MKISFKKISNTHHELAIERRDGSSERVHCETRSYLIHDLSHFAIESEAGLEKGFWGLLAAGKTLNELNDRSGQGIAGDHHEVMVVEAVVGVLHNVSKGVSSAEIMTNLKIQGQGLGWVVPEWLTKDFIDKVCERMRQLLGYWHGTPFGERMVLTWQAEK